MYILAINCGSSSIKGKLYSIPASPSADLPTVASLGVSNISSKGDKVKIKIAWEKGKGQDVNDDGEDGSSVEYQSLVPLLLEKLTGAGEVKKEEVKYIVHRIVHGGTHKKGIRITKEHEEGLQEMDKLSEFAPLHQTIPPETYTYALPPADQETAMPLRKYGFHGLSYASIVQSLSKHLDKPSEKINVVVAHLGSGASSCCIKGGKSIDTSMGLTPLEGLIGGTRSGTIDPTAIFHHTKDCASDAGIEGMKVTKAEAVLNKKSGLQALAGTSNFGTVLSRISDSSSCSSAENDTAKLAYAVFLDRVLSFVSQYLCKLLATTPLEEIDGIVFSGGIGEKGAELRKDVLEKFAWLGAKVDDERNGQKKGEVREITAKGTQVRGWVVETDEEGWCARLAREEFGF